MFNASIREYFLVFNVFIVCIHNTGMLKLIPLLCTHVYSYMFSTVHPPSINSHRWSNIHEFVVIVQIHTILRNIFVDIHLKGKGMCVNMKVLLEVRTSKSIMNLTPCKSNEKNVKWQIDQKHNVKNQKVFMKMKKNVKEKIWATNYFVWIARIG